MNSMVAGVEDISCHRNRSLKDAVRRNVVRQMACESSTRLLERQKGIVRSQLLRQERQLLRSHILLHQFNDARRCSVPQCAVDLLDLDASKHQSDGLDQKAQEDGGEAVVLNPYPITPRPKPGDAVGPLHKAKDKVKTYRRLSYVEEQERARGRNGGPEGSFTRHPSISQVTSEGRVWLGDPEAINSVRRTLRPVRPAPEVRLMGRSQSLREEATVAQPRRNSEDIEVMTKQHRSVSLGDEKMEEQLSNLFLSKCRSYSLRVDAEEAALHHFRQIWNCGRRDGKHGALGKAMRKATNPISSNTPGVSQGQKSAEVGGQEAGGILRASVNSSTGTTKHRKDD